MRQRPSACRAGKGQRSTSSPAVVVDDDLDDDGVASHPFKVTWLQFSEASEFPGDGFPNRAPALTFDKGNAALQTLTSSAGDLLWELGVDATSTDIQLKHDTEGEAAFPE